MTLWPGKGGAKCKRTRNTVNTFILTIYVTERLETIFLYDRQEVLYLTAYDIWQILTDNLATAFHSQATAKLRPNTKLQSIQQLMNVRLYNPTVIAIRGLRVKGVKGVTSRIIKHNEGSLKVPLTLQRPLISSVLWRQYYAQKCAMATFHPISIAIWR